MIRVHSQTTDSLYFFKCVVMLRTHFIDNNPSPHPTTSWKKDTLKNVKCAWLSFFKTNLFHSQVQQMQLFLQGFLWHIFIKLLAKPSNFHCLKESFSLGGSICSVFVNNAGWNLCELCNNNMMNPYALSHIVCSIVL